MEDLIKNKNSFKMNIGYLVTTQKHRTFMGVGGEANMYLSLKVCQGCCASAARTKHIKLQTRLGQLCQGGSPHDVSFHGRVGGGTFPGPQRPDLTRGKAAHST
jgi:hypothetical protein